MIDAQQVGINDTRLTYERSYVWQQTEGASKRRELRDASMLKHRGLRSTGSEWEARIGSNVCASGAV